MTCKWVNKKQLTRTQLPDDFVQWLCEANKAQACVYLNEIMGRYWNFFGHNFLVVKLLCFFGSQFLQLEKVVLFHNYQGPCFCNILILSLVSCTYIIQVIYSRPTNKGLNTRPIFLQRWIWYLSLHSLFICFVDLKNRNW